MIFRPFYYFDRGCAAYLFGCGSLGRCGVVDAREEDVESYSSFAAEKKMQIHTPGHSEDSVCLLVTDLKRGTDPWFVLTGDTLFVGAVGRPDLPGRARENAADLYASIHQKLLTLPDEIEVYPGHFSGSVCGAGLSGKPMSTIGFERRWNPMLSLEREAFVDALSEVLPKPDDMARIDAFNRGRDEIRTGA